MHDQDCKGGSYLQAMAPQPVISPDGSIRQRDFYLFAPIKKRLAGKWFAADTDVKQAVTSWL
jgi:hypothetical protein